MEKEDHIIIDAQPLVSVVIPTHNRSALLKRAILSAQKQSYKKLEIIVVDDASSDDTEDIIRSFDDTRLKYIKHSINRGGSAARNTGIENSSGNYISFLDDDDEWRENKIEHQLREIVGHDVVLCSATFAEKKERTRSYYGKSIVAAEDLRKGFIFSGGTNIILARSSVLREIKFDENLNNGQDWDLLIRLTSNFSVKYINEPLVIYHDENHNRITNSLLKIPIEKIDNYLEIIQKHRDFLGPYWYQYHIARSILAYIGKREQKLVYITYAIKRCGIVPVIRVFADKVLTRLNTYA